MNKEKVHVNQALRKEVLLIVDQLYSEFMFANRDAKNIAIQIIESIGYDYCTTNCGLGLIFFETVIPHLRKLDENQRLQMVKELLTHGYIDIDKYRIHMRFMPYLNYDRGKEQNKTDYVTELIPIPNNS